MFWNCLVAVFMVLLGGAALGVAAMVWPDVVDFKSGMQVLGVLVGAAMLGVRRVQRRRRG